MPWTECSPAPSAHQPMIVCTPTDLALSKKGTASIEIPCTRRFGRCPLCTRRRVKGSRARRTRHLARFRRQSRGSHSLNAAFSARPARVGALHSRLKRHRASSEKVIWGRVLGRIAMQRNRTGTGPVRQRSHARFENWSWDGFVGELLPLTCARGVTSKRGSVGCGGPTQYRCTRDG